MKWWYKLMYNYHNKKKSSVPLPEKYGDYKYHMRKLKYFSQKLGYEWKIVK